jgi:low temperature requirement protein LtrA
MQNRWFHRPTLPSPLLGKERKVGWLELFYDLIYVATIIQLGNALSHHISVFGFLAFAGLMVPLWHTWTGPYRWLRRWPQTRRWSRSPAARPRGIKENS